MMRAKHITKIAMVKCLDMLRGNRFDPVCILVNEHQKNAGFARKFLCNYGGYGLEFQWSYGS